jgi:membrane-associated phospholipid phosphatase
MGVLIGLYLLWRREWRWLITLALVLPGGRLTNVLLKQVFQRDRPTLNGVVSLLTDYSFPSGHVTAATLLYGFLAAFLMSKLPSLSHRLSVVICACVRVCLVGLSLVYLGVHYFSVVVAAASGSIAWLVMWLIVLGSFRRG